MTILLFLWLVQHCLQILPATLKRRTAHTTVQEGKETYGLVDVSGQDMHGLHVSMTDGEVFAEASQM